ncbi:hypothetical protein M1B72_15130 [Geomonas paludis]|uniref:Uncharacterized protein n=1 Tax=Geomonas paludis TaxID=2740185 RepID=A0ABY4L9W3_9BACT|nr:DUF6765 family protein [Geomonas paludis]UPU34775.1 hypothetical protein M1B72_15130 [Geomonas paludis]
MNKEFHYWITGVLACKAGFTDEQVKVISYSSQYVDDNDESIDVFNDEMEPLPCYRSTITQSMNPMLPRTDMMHIYPIFHFIPGDQAKASSRKDKNRHVLNTTPDSSYARAIIDRAVAVFRSDSPTGIYRLGIATHAYADTWAHQNFAGCKDDFNAFADVPLPNIGHADAVHHPDWVAHRWTDSRLQNPEIDNNVRFLAAAKAIYAVFRSARGEEVQQDAWNELKEKLIGIWQGTYSGGTETGGDERVARYREIVPFLPDYDGRLLQDSTLRTEYVPVPGSDNFANRRMWKNGIDPESSPWYLFQEAAKGHVDDAKTILQGLLTA